MSTLLHEKVLKIALNECNALLLLRYFTSVLETAVGLRVITNQYNGKNSSANYRRYRVCLVTRVVKCDSVMHTYCKE